MKIGILTFHCAHNYGAVLQAYGLQETLKAMGHQVEIIDYRPAFLLKPYKIFNIDRFISRNPICICKAIIKECLVSTMRVKRFLAFNHFIKCKLNLSEKKEVNDKYDIYIIGSDQVWNPRITRGFHSPYFADFSFNKNKRKYVSYAPSMGSKELRKEEKTFYKQALQNFDSISVRESQLSILLRPLTEKKVSVVLDPALLAEPTIWESIIIKPKIKEKYVLIYQVRTNSNTMRIASNIAKQINGRVITLHAWLSPNISKNNFQCASPEEFLGWIKYASCVVTTSFHGTAFSIVFNTPFYTIKLENDVDVRSLSILKQVGLNERFISKDSSPKFTTIDFTNTNSKLLELRNLSKRFLLRAIS